MNNYKEIPYTREAMEKHLSTPGVLFKVSIESSRPYTPRYIHSNGYIACDLTYLAGSISAHTIAPSPNHFILIPMLEEWVPFDKVEEIPFGKLAMITSRRSMGVITAYEDGDIYFNSNCVISRNFAAAFRFMELVHQNPDGTIQTDENGEWITQPFGKKVEVAS